MTTTMSTTTNSNTSSTKIVLITYEFTFSTFSGNGILARSLVKALLRQGCHVTVWCMQTPSDDKAQSGHPLQVPELSQEEFERLVIITTTISTIQKWRRLDDESAWDEFVWTSLSASAQSSLLEAQTQAKAVLVIDWTGHHAFQSIPAPKEAPLTLVYLNFRVFSSGVTDATKRQWYDERERSAVEEASLVVALSEKDKASLRTMMKDGHQSNIKDIHVLVPPLRGDVEALARGTNNTTDNILQHLPPKALQAATLKPGTNDTITSTTTNQQPRKCFITCVVRLSPEKNTRRFVRFLEATKPFWKERQWIPLLAGASSDPEYAQIVKEELQSVCGKDGCVILESFLPPASLAAVFACTVVNFHPCSYDAYGMTIMEAAAFGVPSVIAQGNHVGAAIHVGNGASIEVPMENDDDTAGANDMVTEEAVVKALETLTDTTKLELIGKLAKERALAWGEDAYGKAMLQMLSSI